MVNTYFSTFDILILIGIAQGVITAIVMLSSSKNKIALKFFALGLLAFCFLSTKILLHTLGLWDTKTFRYFPNGIELAIAPLFYFYVLAILNSNFFLQKKHLLHFIPFILSQSFAFIVYFNLIGESDLNIKDQIASSFFFDQVKRVEDYLSLISLLTYSSLTIVKWKNVSDKSELKEKNKNAWIKFVFISFILLGVFLIFNFSLDIANPSSPSRELRWKIYFIFLSCLIYFISYIALRNLNKSTSRKAEKAPIYKDASSSGPYLAKLNKALEIDKVYLNPKLNIKLLSENLGIPLNQLSYIVNENYDMSFRDLLNEYRINEVLRRVNEKGLESYTLLSYAFECGFNSEATFYRNFKKITGQTPKIYFSQEA